jgi:hypothetical protein
MSKFQIAATLCLGATLSTAQAETISYSTTKGGDPFITIFDTNGAAYADIYGPNCAVIASYAGGLAGRFTVNHNDPGWQIVFNNPQFGNGYIFDYLLDKKALTWGLWAESTSAGLTFQEINAGGMFKVKACR